MVIGPTFMGAEPDRIDEGPHAGLRLFRTEELESLKLMQGLPTELQEKATLSKGMEGKSLPADRWNPFDERHLAGARQDNRIVPFGKTTSSSYGPITNMWCRGLPSIRVPARQARIDHQPLPRLQRILSRTSSAAQVSSVHEISARNIFRLDWRIWRRRPILLPNTQPCRIHGARLPLR